MFTPQDELKDLMQVVKPDAMMLLPFHLTRIWKAVIQKVQNSKFGQESIKLLSTATRAQMFNEEGKLHSHSRDLSFGLSIRDALVAKKVRALFGGKLKLILTSGAKCDTEMLEFFWGMGIKVFDGYCSTETLVCTFNTPQSAKLGSAGTMAHGVEVKIADDGEILTKSPLMFKGYYNSPHQTKEAIDKDGWFHTGDKGNC